MREILFRGKPIGGGEFIYGHYTEHKGVAQIWIGSDNGQWNYLVSPETVGQFTGLTDKNGKKIYEGDIGKYKQTDGAKRNGQPISCTGKVIYNTKTASYAVESKDEAGCKYFDYFPIKDFEVIGNIHDNPELLEVTDNA